jgi:hypothetical protein
MTELHSQPFSSQTQPEEHLIRTPSRSYSLRAEPGFDYLTNHQSHPGFPHDAKHKSRYDEEFQSQFGMTAMPAQYARMDDGDPTHYGDGLQDYASDGAYTNGHGAQDTHQPPCPPTNAVVNQEQANLGLAHGIRLRPVSELRASITFVSLSPSLICYLLFLSRSRPLSFNFQVRGFQRNTISMP